MRSAAVPITERKRKSLKKEKVVKDKGKTSKRKSVAASTIDLEEDYMNQCKVEVYYKTTTTFEILFFVCFIVNLFTDWHITKVSPVADD
jgi:hypothetical protein